MTEHKIKIIRRRLFINTVVLSVSIIAAFMLVSVSFYEQQQNTIHNREVFCRAQHNLAGALINILKLAKTTAESDTKATPDQRDRAVKFYNQALALTAPIDCHKSLKP